MAFSNALWDVVIFISKPVAVLKKIPLGWVCGFGERGFCGEMGRGEDMKGEGVDLFEIGLEIKGGVDGEGIRGRLGGIWRHGRESYGVY